jgi:hypothetical protein
MTDDILDHVGFIIFILVIGAVLIVLGLAFHSVPLVILGGIFDGAIPTLKLVLWILQEYG